MLTTGGFMRFNFIKSSIVMSSLLLPLISSGQVAQSGDWTLTEQKINNVDTCTLRIVDKVFLRAPDFVMEISKQKNSINTPVEIVMRVVNNKRGNTSLIAKVQQTKSIMSFLDIDGTKSTYWGFAKNLSALINQLAVNNTNIEMMAQGGEKSFDFSIKSKGFSDVYKTMISRCNFNKPLVSSRFEAALFENTGGDLTQAGIPTAKINFYRNSYFAAFNTFAKLENEEANLAGVLAKYKVFQDELSTNRSEKSNILSVQIPNAKNTLASAQQTQIIEKNNIARLQQLIPQLANQLQASKNAYNQSKAVIAPLEPQYNNLTSQVNQTSNQLNSATNRLSVVEDLIQDNDRLVYQLRQDSQRLENELVSDRSQRDQARRDLDIAREARADYNVEEQKISSLSENDRYNGLKIEFETTRSLRDGKLEDIEINTQDLDAQKDQLAQDCATEELQADQKCVDLKASIARLEFSIGEDKASVETYQNQMESMRNKIAEIEKRTERQVQDTYRQLVDVESRAGSRFNQWDSAVFQKQNSLNRIRNVDLPSALNQQNQLASEESDLRFYIPQYQQNLSSAQQRLSQFKQVNNWDAKANDLAQKTQKLNSDQNSFDSANNELSRSQNSLSNAQSTEVQMKQLLINLDQRIVALDKRAVELQQIISKLPAERAPIDQKIEAIKVEFKNKINDFTS